MPVYQYQGKHYQLPDGLSDEQAITKIKGHLGQAEPAEKGLMGQAWDNTKKIAQEGLETFVGATNPFAPKSGSQELAGVLGTGIVAEGLAPIPAAIGALNDMSQGKPADFGQKWADAQDAMTYTPKTESGIEGTEKVGKFMQRNLMPIAPMIIGNLGNIAARSRYRADIKRYKDGDIAVAPEELLQKKQDQRLDINLDEGADTQGTLYADREGVVTPQLPDEATQLAKQRQQAEVDSPTRVFDEMQRQLRNGEQSMLPEQTPDPMAAMARQLEEQAGRRAQEGDVNQMWQTLERQRIAQQQHGQVMEGFQKQEQFAGEQQQAAAQRLEEVKRQQDQLEQARRTAEAEEAMQRRQQMMEDQVKRQTSIDMNAAERQRQEQAPVPGLENFQQETRYEQVRKAVDEDPRVKTAEERVRKAEELALRVADGFENDKATKEHLKRVERDLEEFEKRLEWVRNNVEFEHLNKERKKNQIRSDTPYSRQRGAWKGPEYIKDAFDRMGKGILTARDYLSEWKGAFDERQWSKVLRDLDDPNSTRTVVLMSPREFHRLAEPRGADGMQDAPRLHQNIRQGLTSERGLLDAPTLWVEKAQDGQLRVVAHEGRNRMDVFREEGIQKVPVVFDSKDIKWGQDDIPPHIRPEWVGDKTVLDMPTPKVLHEGPADPHREPTRAANALRDSLRQDARSHIGALGQPDWVKEINAKRIKSPGNKQGGFILMPGSKKKALDNLASKLGIEQKLGEMAPTQWTPEEALEAAKGAKDVDQNFIQKGINYFTKGGLYQALKTHNPLVRYTYEELVNKDRLARADIRDWVHAKLSPQMRALTNEEQGSVWSILEVADLNQKPIDLEMLARHGFTEKQIQYAKSHQEAMEYAYRQINKAREAAGKPPIDHRTAYAAMRATGDFRRLVYIGDEVVGVIGSDYRHGLNNLMKQMEEKGFTVGEERYFGGMPRERGSANQAFIHAIEALADNDPKMQHFIDVLNTIRTTEVYNFLNAKTHTMDKKGVFGMEGRKPWLTPEENAKEGFRAQLNYMEAAIKWGHLSEAATNIKKVLDAKEVNMPNAKQWSEKYLYNSLGFNPSEIGRSIEQSVANMFKGMGVGYSVGREGMAMARKVTNALLLGMNPRFWATNVVQPLQAMPAMKAMLISRGLDAGFDFGTGYSYIMEGGSTVMKPQSMLTEFEKASKAYAKKYHVYGSDMIEHSNRVRKDSVYYLDKASNAVAGQVEIYSRQVMFHGFAHMLKENGMKPGHGLFEAAHNLTDMAMNNYSTLERPQVYNTLGPLGDLAVNLQSYKHNELSRLAFFAREAADNKAFRPIATQLATSVAFGGILGVIGFSEADYLYRTLTKAMGKPDSLTNMVIKMSEKVGKNTETDKDDYVASHGVFSMLGVDMSRNLGLTDVVPDTLGDLAFPGGSKLGEIATAGYQAAKNPTEMNAKRLARAAAPIGMQGMVDNAFFTKDTLQGKLAVNPTTLRGQAYRNTTDTVVKNFGFQGLNESVQKQKTYNVEKNARDYADLRQKPLSKMRDELFATGRISPETVKAYVDARGNPKTLLGDLQRYQKEQNMSARELSLMRAAAGKAIASQAKARDYISAFQK
jgi:hypothetical protein